MASSSLPKQYLNMHRMALLFSYDAIESVESRMQEVLSPTPDGEYVGSAIVQEVFNIGGTGNIAGSKCRDGLIKKGSNVRVMRGDKILVESKVRTLRNFKVCFMLNTFPSLLFSMPTTILFTSARLQFFRLKLMSLTLGMNVVLVYLITKTLKLEILLKAMSLKSKPDYLKKLRSRGQAIIVAKCLRC